MVDKRKLTTRLPPSPPLLYLEITLEPTCYRCGASVEPGALFCQQCGAPQIRVVVSETVHITVKKALRILGFGTKQLIVAPVDEFVAPLAPLELEVPLVPELLAEPEV